MSERPSSTELLAWTLVGLATGLVAGALAGAWLRPDPDSAQPLVRRREKARPAPRPLRVAEAARVVLERIQEDATLRDLSLEVLAVGPGVIELHGWVASRGERTRAARIAASVPGVTNLVNSLLVHGEDDYPVPVLDADDQTA
jgi:hypothetical protein